MTQQEEIVQKQLDFYNNQDLEGFCSTYSDDIEIFNLLDNSTILKGKEALRKRYTERFKNPELYAVLTNRMTIGNKVIDYEQVRGIDPDGVVKAIAVYEVLENVISRVWFIYEN